MQFNSWAYLIFLIGLFAIYYCLDNQRQKWLLLAASYGFYSLWDWRLTLLPVVVTGVAYIAGKRIASTENIRARQAWLTMCLLVTLGLLAGLKYYDFFLMNLYALFDRAGFRVETPLLQIVVPIGLSFYTFQALTYPLDIHRRTLVPARRLLDVALFVAFFPQLTAGPIERARNILPQLQQRRRFDIDEFERGIWLLVWGLFKKVFVADNLALLVNNSFEQSATINFPSAYVSVIAYAFQIYCDFSSYTDMARGSAKLFGIRLMDNFHFPYLAANPREFWRRWHISLSSWLRDYVYIPLGGNRAGQAVTYRNILVTMTLCGLWHGAAWNFVLWGLYQGILLVVYDLASKRFEIHIDKRVSTALMFQCTLFGWLLFRSSRVEMIDGLPDDQSLAQIGEFLGSVSRGFSVDPAFWSLLQNMLLFISPLLLVEMLMLKSDSKYALFTMPSYVALPVKAVLLFLIVAYGVQTGERFIYLKF